MDDKNIVSLSGEFPEIVAISGILSCDPRTPKTDVYKGEYQITPHAFKEQILNTSNKLLKQNITVKKIPYFETSNECEGKTVYIAKEIE